jgi:hypothetical protein
VYDLCIIYSSTWLNDHYMQNIMQYYIMVAFFVCSLSLFLPIRAHCPSQWFQINAENWLKLPARVCKISILLCKIRNVVSRWAEHKSWKVWFAKARKKRTLMTIVRKLAYIALYSASPHAEWKHRKESKTDNLFFFLSFIQCQVSR